MDKYLKQIEEAFDYAASTGSFNKLNIIDNAKHVCVFGLGRYFQSVQKRFKVTYLCDNNPMKLAEISANLKFGTGLKCISPAELANLEDVIVIIMLGDPRSAEKQLDEMKIFHMTYNDVALDEVMEANRDKEKFLLEKENLINAFQLLNDEESRKVFANIFCNRLAPHLSNFYYDELCTEPQYFQNDILNLSNAESIVDCGAYNGDTLLEYMKIQKDFSDYYAFELDEDNYNDLNNAIKEVPSSIAEKIHCYNCGTWDKTMDISYGKMSSSDSFSINNKRDVHKAKVVALDEVLVEKKISLIKMDIEGAELKSLQGAKKIIQTQKPKLAICVYHKVEDMWAIPLYLKSLVPDYKFAIRHHANFHVCETVCYAYINENK